MAVEVSLIVEVHYRVPESFSVVTYSGVPISSVWLSSCVFNQGSQNSL